jgi:hypothetical protein
VALVQGAASSSAVTSGTAGASLTGVTAGNGLVCFVLYESAATARTLTDSSGTTWALWNALTLTASCIAVFHTTSAVVAGTHTVTASFTGGSGAWTYLFEDNQSPTAGVPNAATLTAPGAGNSIKAGVLGVTGSSVYQLALNRTHSTSGYQPQPGDFSTQYATNFDSAIGAWQIAGGTNVGGTNAGAAVGPSDPTGADNYAVLEAAFQPSGNAIPGPTNQLVLVDEDVGPVRRTPYPLGMFFWRNTFLPPSTPLAYMSVKTPPWEFYRDPFTSVYPVLELYSQIPVAPSKRQFFLFPKTGRLDPPEEDIQRANHSAYFMLSRHYTAQMVGYTVETPDFNDHPWLEWVHPKLDDETAIFPYRRIPVITPPGPNAIFWGQPKPWWVGPEEDSQFRHPPSLDILIPFPRPTVQLVMPNLIGLDLQAALAVAVANFLNVTSVQFEDSTYPMLPQPRGTVIQQSPLAGTVIDVDEPTVVICSSGLANLPCVGDSVSFPINFVIGGDSLDGSIPVQQAPFQPPTSAGVPLYFTQPAPQVAVVVTADNVSITADTTQVSADS